MLDRELVRYVLVGGINTSFSYSVYAALVFFGVNFAKANFCAVALGILFSFKTHGYLVFRNSANRLFLRYATFWFLIYLCNIGFIKLLLMAGFNAYIAGAMALPPIALVSYLLQKHAVFKPVAQLHRKS